MAHFEPSLFIFSHASMCFRSSGCFRPWSIKDFRATGSNGIAFRPKHSSHAFAIVLAGDPPKGSVWVSAAKISPFGLRAFSASCSISVIGPRILRFPQMHRIAIFCDSSRFQRPSQRKCHLQAGQAKGFSVSMETAS